MILSETVLFPAELVIVIVEATSDVPLDDKLIVAAELDNVTPVYRVWISTVRVAEPVICIVWLFGNVTV